MCARKKPSAGKKHDKLLTNSHTAGQKHVYTTSCELTTIHNEEVKFFTSCYTRCCMSIGQSANSVTLSSN